jgi:hypothetical protein
MKVGKVIHGDAAKGYRLALAGHAMAVTELQAIAA